MAHRLTSPYRFKNLTRFQAKKEYLFHSSAAVDTHTLNAKSSEILLLMFDLTHKSLISSERHHSWNVNRSDSQDLALGSKLEMFQR